MRAVLQRLGTGSLVDRRVVVKSDLIKDRLNYVSS
jgi:hypothetical protein